MNPGCPLLQPCSSSPPCSPLRKREGEAILASGLQGPLSHSDIRLFTSLRNSKTKVPINPGHWTLQSSSHPLCFLLGPFSFTLPFRQSSVFVCYLSLKPAISPTPSSHPQQRLSCTAYLITSSVAVLQIVQVSPVCLQLKSGSWSSTASILAASTGGGNILFCSLRLRLFLQAQWQWQKQGAQSFR